MVQRHLGEGCEDQGAKEQPQRRLERRGTGQQQTQRQSCGYGKIDSEVLPFEFEARHQVFMLIEGWKGRNACHPGVHLNGHMGKFVHGFQPLAVFRDRLRIRTQDRNDGAVVSRPELPDVKIFPPGPRSIWL